MSSFISWRSCGCIPVLHVAKFKPFKYLHTNAEVCVCLCRANSSPVGQAEQLTSWTLYHLCRPAACKKKKKEKEKKNGHVASPAILALMAINQSSQRFSQVCKHCCNICVKISTIVKMTSIQGAQNQNRTDIPSRVFVSDEYQCDVHSLCCFWSIKEIMASIVVSVNTSSLARAPVFSLEPFSFSSSRLLLNKCVSFLFSFLLEKSNL